MAELHNIGEATGSVVRNAKELTVAALEEKVRSLLGLPQVQAEVVASEQK